MEVEVIGIEYMRHDLRGAAKKDKSIVNAGSARCLHEISTRHDFE